MQFTKLRVSGFKSFSDPAELLIADGLTGIVGPNGCGKSNIVDALRWVMGETSVKGLRGTEMEDVIFSGSALRPAFDMAEVALRIRGPVEGPVLLQSGEETDIVRKLARGTGSSYRISGSEVRARDVHHLLADVAAGARSAAIVGQGQISQVVDARPDERRRMLEDAAGLSGLQGRRREAESRLRQTEANLDRILDLLGTREARLEELKKQGKEAERYRRIAAELRAAETILLFRRRNESEAQLREAKAAMAEAERATAGTQAAITTARDERRHLLDQLADARATAEAAGIELARLEERHRGEEARVERRHAEVAEQRTRLQEAERDLAASSRELADLEERAATMLEERARLGSAIERLTAASSAAEHEAQAASAAYAQAAAERDRRMAELLGTQAAQKAAATALEAARQRHGQLEGSRTRLTEAPAADGGDRSEAELASARQTLQAAIAAEDAAERRVAELEANLALTRSRHAECAEQREGLQRSVAEQRAAILAAEARHAERRQRRELVGRNRERGERRASELEARRRSLEGQVAEEPIERARFAVDGADARLEGARRELTASEARFIAHDATQRALEEEARRLAELVRRLEDELEGLAPLLAAVDPQPIAAAIEGAEEWQTALAAALGDDLLAGTDLATPRHWRHTQHVHPWIGDPPLPQGIEPLAARIAAPAQLQRRLQQIGICDAATAEKHCQRLAVGQRLVSLEGHLWRWDGFVRRAGTDQSAVLLHQFHRQDRLVAEAAAARARLERVEQDLPAKRTAVAAARAALEAARRAVQADEASSAERRAELAKLEEARLRASSELAGLAPEIAALDGELAEILAELEALGAETGSLAEPRDALAKEEARLRQIETEWQALRRQLEGLERTIEAARRAATATRRDTEAKREALEQARLRHDDLQQGRLRAELEREAELERVEAELGELELALPTLAETASRADRALEAASEAQASVESLLGRAGTAREEAAGKEAALRTEIAALEAQLRANEAAQAELPPRQDAAAARVGQLGLRIERTRALLEASQGEADRDDLGGLRDELEAARGEQGLRAADAQRLAAELAELERALALIEAEGMRLSELSGQTQAARASAQSALEAAILAIRERIREPLDASAASIEEHPVLAALPTAELERRLERLRTARDRVGPVNLRADVEATELERQLDETRHEAADIKTAVNRLNEAISTLNREARERLLRVFETVELHFARLFKQLFGGGKAHLRLTDLEDPLNAGLDFEAMPPGKKLSHVSLLSGGEKTLAALALVFAFFLAKPSPLCVLDEVDAPLDDANVERVTALMAEIATTTGTRFLVVTHHPLTMARMDRLYGITMIERGVSRIVSVALEEAVELRATA